MSTDELVDDIIDIVETKVNNKLAEDILSHPCPHMYNLYSHSGLNFGLMHNSHPVIEIV